MAALSTLYDQFSGSIDSSKWTYFQTGAATITQTGGVVVATPPSSNGTPSYAAYDSANTFNLTGSYGYLKVPSTTGNNAAQTYYKLAVDTNNYLEFMKEGSLIKFRKTVSGVTTQLASATYNSSTHLWWQFRESSGTCYWDTSTDGITWTNRASTSNPFSMTVFVEFGTGTFSSVPSPGVANFDNFNARSLTALTTEAVSSITTTTATGNGTLTDDGGMTVDLRGVVYDTSTHTDPGNVSPAASSYASKAEESGTFTTGAFTESITGITHGTTYYVRSYAHNALGYSYGSQVSFTTDILAPTVTTQAVSAIGRTTATGNGTVTDDGGGTITERGVCWKTSSGPTTADSTATSAGTTGAYTASMTGLVAGTLYYAKAYAINAAGTSYGGQVTFTTAGFTNPTNAYSSNNVYATTLADNGDIKVYLSGDAGSTYTTALTKTFTGSETSQTYGTGSTELWGSSWLGTNVNDTNFRLKITCGTSTEGQIYKTFGFAPSGSVILTGIEVSVEAKWDGTTTSVDHVKVKIYYGSSSTPVQAGSTAYDTTLNTLTAYSGSAWRALLTVDGAATAYQPLDSDLTTIAGLTATTDNFMVATASAWASRTPSQARTQLGLGSLATQSGTFSGTSSGTNTGDQTITLTGDVTGSGTGSFAATIAADAVTPAMLAYGSVYRRQGGDASDYSLQGTNAYDTSASNIIVQMGAKQSSSSADVTVTFPVAFSQPPIIVGSVSGTTVETDFVKFPVVTASTATLRCTKHDGVRQQETCHWIAIGPA